MFDKERESTSHYSAGGAEKFLLDQDKSPVKKIDLFYIEENGDKVLGKLVMYDS